MNLNAPVFDSYKKFLNSFKMMMMTKEVLFEREPLRIRIKIFSICPEGSWDTNLLSALLN